MSCRHGVPSWCKAEWMALKVPTSGADPSKWLPNRKLATAVHAFWLEVPAVGSVEVTSCFAIPIAFVWPRFGPNDRDRVSAGGCNPLKLSGCLLYFGARHGSSHSTCTYHWNLLNTKKNLATSDLVLQQVPPINCVSNEFDRRYVNVESNWNSINTSHWLIQQQKENKKMIEPLE
jgi:hypothetical protein